MVFVAAERSNMGHISSVRTLIGEIQLVERNRNVVVDADFRKWLIQRYSFEHGQTYDL